MQDSLEMSQLLLKDMAAGHEAQYGAVVFDDPILEAIPQAMWDMANATGLPLTGLAGLAGLSGSAAGLLGALPLLGGGGVPFFPGLPGGAMQGSSALINRLGTPESRVLISLVKRFRNNPGAPPLFWNADHVKQLLLKVHALAVQARCSATIGVVSPCHASIEPYVHVRFFQVADGPRAFACPCNDLRREHSLAMTMPGIQMQLCL